MYHVIADDPFEIISTHESFVVANTTASVGRGERAQSTQQVFVAQRKTLEACYR